MDGQRRVVVGDDGGNQVGGADVIGTLLVFGNGILDEGNKGRDKRRTPLELDGVFESGGEGGLEV
jgi:hypothetical protein